MVIFHSYVSLKRCRFFWDETRWSLGFDPGGHEDAGFLGAFVGPVVFDPPPWWRLKLMGHTQTRQRLYFKHGE